MDYVAKTKKGRSGKLYIYLHKCANFLPLPRTRTLPQAAPTTHKPRQSSKELPAGAKQLCPNGGKDQNGNGDRGRRETVQSMHSRLPLCSQRGKRLCPPQGPAQRQSSRNPGRLPKGCKQGLTVYRQDLPCPHSGKPSRRPPTSRLLPSATGSRRTSCLSFAVWKIGSIRFLRKKAFWADTPLCARYLVDRPHLSKTAQARAKATKMTPMSGSRSGMSPPPRL